MVGYRPPVTCRAVDGGKGSEAHNVTNTEPPATAVHYERGKTMTNMMLRGSRYPTLRSR